MQALQPRTLAAYNRWMNERLYAVCAGIGDTERRRDRGAFFGSVQGTLNHLLVADRLWMSRFTGESFSVPSLDTELFADFDALRRERERTDAAIDAWAADLDAETLAGTLHYTTMVDPQPRSTPLWLAVTHFFNHQTHHRGQLTTLLSQMGVDYGVTDLLWLPSVD